MNSDNKFLEEDNSVCIFLTYCSKWLHPNKEKMDSRVLILRPKVSKYLVILDASFEMLWI